MNIFSKFYKKKTRTYIKILRHSSLDSNVNNTYAKFHSWNLHSKRDMYVQKIKVKKSIFRYIYHYLRSFISYLQFFYISRKGSYPILKCSKVYLCYFKTHSIKNILLELLHVTSDHPCLSLTLIITKKNTCSDVNA